MNNGQLVSERRRKLKKMIVNYMGGRCARCGWDEHQAGLVPHHVNESKKSFALSSDGVPRKWETIEAECKKCILLCNNCHNVIHAIKEPYWFDEANIPDYGTFYDDSARKEKALFFCIDCNTEISYKASRCNSCAGRHNATIGRNAVINWPVLSKVIDLVEMHGYSGTGRILGVSDNAVRKHIKTHSRVR